MKNKELLLLDTNIISNAMSKHGQEAYLEQLDLLLPSYKLGVTLYMQYELLKSSDKEHQMAILKYLSEDYFRIKLSENVINFSARIFNLYSRHKDTKGLKITDGDVINGAITIAKNCHIMTMDSNDYPRPFFQEVSRHKISYMSSSRRPVVDFAYILSPDIDHLRHCAKELKI
jgi:predicted nucleic acid-binding protein